MAEQKQADKKNKLKQKIKSAVQRHKKQIKTEGDPKITGVKKPKKKKVGPVKEVKEKKTGGTQQAQTGPKGGQYKIAPTGKKYYLQSESTRTFHRDRRDVKKAIDEIIREEKITKVINNFKKGDGDLGVKDE